MKTLLLLLPFLLGGQTANAANIVNVSGSAPFGFGNQFAFATGWHQTTTFSNVSIMMPLRDGTDAGPIGTKEGIVYLMNLIGANATSANEVAPPVSIFGLASSFTNVLLFSGLTLGPGDYYIVLAPTHVGSGIESLSPEGDSNPVFTLGGGVTMLNGGSSTNFSSYAPSNDFHIDGQFVSPANFFLNVYTPLDTSGVPEPSTWVFLGFGLAAMGASRLGGLRKAGKTSN